MDSYPSINCRATSLMRDITVWFFFWLYPVIVYNHIAQP